MRTRGATIAAALAVLGVACAQGQPGIERPDPPGFDRSALIDVLPPDAIPAVRDPESEPAATASRWLTEESPVLAVEIGGEARAYPLAILTRHEIVNDELGGERIAATYCPLCNTGIVYRRSVEGRALTFIVSGKLYHSDLVMLDLQTETLWPQVLGAAVLGALKGTELEVVPSSLVSFAQYRESFPRGDVLARPAGRSYGENPYVGYEARARPFEELFVSDLDARLPAMERVVGVSVGKRARAYPLSAILARGAPAVLRDRIGDTDLVIMAEGVQRSALDAAVIADGKAIASTGVFEPVADGRRLSLLVRDGRIEDRETGSAWTVLGVARSGPLRGARLRPLHHLDAFWFAWAAFVPITEVWEA